MKFWVRFPGVSVVKSLPAKQKTRVGSLGREDPLEKKMATHSSVLAWEIPAWWATVRGVTKESDDLASKQGNEVLSVALTPVPPLALWFLTARFCSVVTSAIVSISF